MTKVTHKMAELCTEYPFLTIIAAKERGEEKKWIDFAISHCLCLFHGQMRPLDDSKQGSSESLFMRKRIYR